MADDAVAVLDAPAEIAPPDTGSGDDSTTGADGFEAPSGEQSDTPADGAKADGQQQRQAAPLFEGKNLSEHAKATLAEIRAKDPAFANQLKNALLQNENMRGVLSGGIKEAVQLKRTVEELGGVEGIETLRAEQQEWNSLDQKFTNADPSFVEDIAQSSPDSFLALVPTVIGKFQEMNPEGYASYISQVFIADMVANRIPLALDRLRDFIPTENNPRAAAVLKQIDDYLARLDEYSKKPLVPTKEKPAPDSREQEITTREARVTQTEWETAANSGRMELFGSELKRLTEGRKVTGEQAAAIRELYASRMRSILNGTKDFKTNVDRYFASRDRKGYLRYMTSIYKESIPRALRSAVDTILPKTAGARPAAVANGNGKPPAAKPAAAQGFQWVGSAPPAEQMNVRLTTTEMVKSGKAILLSGKKVQWK